jgi:hypothetical protein
MSWPARNGGSTFGGRKVEELNAFLQDTLNCEEARQYLDLPRAPLLGLLNEGILAPVLADW